MAKFDSAKVIIHLVRYGHEISWSVSHLGRASRKEPWMEMVQVRSRTRDYGSDKTGQLVFQLLEALAVKNWSKMAKVMAKIRQQEG